ncbi:MAG: sugar phosphate nucleotidyltransferase [Nanoarchaeota archaeon]|jgi:NDP-sugar pyrophosphorylase family protein|nr:sugar phosphate nucleotidyltransferase [Nanoarchaeota archaeon]
MKEISIVFMLAGMSSRFGGRAKAFADVGPNGENLLEYSLNQALKAGFRKIIFIVSPKTEKLFVDYYGNSYKGVPIVYALQEYDEETRDRPWGTNDALCSARDLIEGPFVICNGDDIYGENAFKELYDHLQSSEEDATIGYKLGKVLSDAGSVNRGIFETKDGYIKTVTETLGITREKMSEMGLNDDDLCSMNLFGLQKGTLDLLYDKLIHFKLTHADDRNIECYLPHELNSLIAEGKIKMRLYETDDLWIGVTVPEDEQIVRGILAKL